MKHILVVTDLSPQSEHAYQFAIELAEATGARISLLSFLEASPVSESALVLESYTFNTGAMEELQDEAIEAFERLTKKYPSKVNVHFEVIHDTLASGITHFLDDHNINLIISCQLPENIKTELPLANNTDKIIRIANTPVLTLPKAVAMAELKNIVFPNQLLDSKEDNIKSLKELQHLLNATLHILYVNTPYSFLCDEEAQDAFKKFSNRYRFKNVTYNFRSHHNILQGILAFRKEINADMIAMGTHGRKGLGHFLKGCMAESLLHESQCPIYSFKIKA